MTSKLFAYAVGTIFLCAAIAWIAVGVIMSYQFIMAIVKYVATM